MPFRLASPQAVATRTVHYQIAIAEIAKWVFHDGSAPFHHLGMQLHSLSHTLEGLFMGVTRDIAPPGLRASGFQLATSAVVDGCLVNSFAFAALFER
ncbi:hypothetical protein D3C80_1885330 [compost metagenome]